MVFSARNEYQYGIFLLLPQFFCRLYAVHSLHLYVKENNVKPLPRCKESLTRDTGLYMVPWLLFFNQVTYMLPDHFFIIYNCNFQNISPQIHTGIPFLYRQKFSVYRAEGTKSPLFGNERLKPGAEISKSV